MNHSKLIFTESPYKSRSASYLSQCVDRKINLMPYIKKKGVRDLYLIRIARIGKKSEIHPKSNDNEPRLVFELEYLESLPDYEMVNLNVHYTYRDTLLGSIFR